MKVFSLATLTLKRNKKQYMIYGLTLIFAIVIHLIFSEFINNPYLIAVSYTHLTLPTICSV